MKRVQEIVRGSDVTELHFVSKSGIGKLRYDGKADTFVFIGASGSPISSIPNADVNVVGGIKMRVDTATGTVYITNDGTQP